MFDAPAPAKKSRTKPARGAQLESAEDTAEHNGSVERLGGSHEKNRR